MHSCTKVQKTFLELKKLTETKVQSLEEQKRKYTRRTLHHATLVRAKHHLRLVETHPPLVLVYDRDHAHAPNLSHSQAHHVKVHKAALIR